MDYSLSMPNARPVTPAAKINLKQISLPTEHGSWGFLFEPIVVALAIGPSFSGLAIAVMTIGAFLARQPLKVLIIDRLGQKNSARARAAVNFLILFSAISAAGFASTLYLTGIRPLMPFILVLPFAAVQIYFDGSRKSRGLLPELLGGVSISASSAAIMLAGGASVFAAAAIWILMIARLIPSIIYIRNRLRLEKGKRHSFSQPVAFHSAAFIAVVVLAYYGGVPWLAVAAMAILLFRTVNGLSASRKKLKAMQIGVLEVVYGAVTVFAIVLGHYIGV